MNPIDAAILLILLLGVAAGARAGFFGPALGLLGGAIGFGIALLLATAFREQLAPIEQPVRALLTFITLVAFVLVGEGTGSALGSRLSHGVRNIGLRPLEAVGGAAVGAAHVVLVVWLIGGMLAAGLAPGLGGLAQDSVALRSVHDRFPPPAVVAGRLMTLLDMTDLPPLFAGLEPAPAPPVDMPADADVAALAQSAIGGTARISSVGCGPGLAVGSGFFISPTDVVTNAHVVAGGTETTVTIGATVQVATVVAFDPASDLALLRVPGGQATPLRLSAEPPQRGTHGAAMGYPGGGELTVVPAAVTATYEIGGPDIYGSGISERSVVELRTRVRPGNSGGPLMVAPGVVGGVVFGASRTTSDVGYAIGADQATASIGPFIGSTAPVGTGGCL